MKISKIITALVVAFALTACGGGSSSTPDDSNTSTPPAVVQNPPKGKGIAVCSGSDQGFAEATVLTAGKKIQQIKDTPNIHLWHLSDGTRKACVASGSAEVLYEENGASAL
jgi:ABC-type glycerol-3-phosphate transport system substrate-binding protein